MRIGVVGVGYVGLSTAVCLATKFQCVAIDKNKERIAELDKGTVSIHEKGLQTMLAKGVAANRLAFSSQAEAIFGTDVIFIAVGTPANADGSIDLSQVREAARSAGAAVKAATNGTLVLVRSTVTPGTTREIIKPLIEESSGKSCGEGFGLCSNPEFLREGTAIQDSLAPKRLIIGAVDRSSGLAARSLYRRFYGSKMPPVVETTPEGAELVKYGSNSFLATKVSFINLLAKACELYPGTDINDVARGMGLDPRIGHLFLQAGPGFGGSCFPKDIRAFSSYLRRLGLDSSALDGVIGINESQAEHVLALAEKKAGRLDGKDVAVLGLAFKAGTDDIRESRSISVVLGLLNRKAKVRVYDPVAMQNARSQLGKRVVYSSSPEDCIRGADVVIAMTAWPQLQALKPKDFQRLMRSPILVDARRVYDPAKYSRALEYSALGRGEGSAQ